MPERIIRHITDHAIKIGLRWFAVILFLSGVIRMIVLFDEHWLWFSRIICSAVCFGLSATIHSDKPVKNKPNDIV